jgi:hypothetical protein
MDSLIAAAARALAARGLLAHCGFFVPLAVVLHVPAIRSITSHARTAFDAPFAL